MEESAASENRPAMIRWIVIGVFIWGAGLALGAAIFPAENNLYRILKPAIIMTCVIAFLGFWGLMLRARANRLRRESLSDAKK